MILEFGIAVERGMHPGQVIRFAVVLHGELPIATHLDREPGIGGGGPQLRPAAGARKSVRAGAKRRDVPLESRRIPAQVDEDDAHELQATAHLL